MLAVTQTHALQFGAEVSFGSIAGPFDACDAYVDSSASPAATIEWRLYATVGGLTSLVAKGLAGGSVAQLVKWETVGSPAKADGTTYELRAYWQGQGAAPALVKASLVGYNATDVVGNSANGGVQQIPAGFGEVTFATLAGYAQYADASVAQTGLSGDVVILLYALAEAGGVEALVDSQLLMQSDGTTRVFARVPLPGASQYRLAAKATNASGFGLQIDASLAVYSDALVGPITPTKLAPGPQITTLRSVTPTAPTSVVWASTGYVDFVADCGADPTGVVDCAPAFDRAFQILSTLAATSPLAETALKLFLPPGLYALKSTPVTATWNFLNLTTSLEIVGAGMDATVLKLYGFDPPGPANLQNCRIADMTLMGTGLGAVNDCVFGWVPQHIQQLCLFERIRGFNVRAQYSVLHSFAAGVSHLRNCIIISCSSQTDGYGTMTVRAFVVARVESCVCQDVGSLNGVQYDGNYLKDGRSWLAFVGNNAVAGGFAIAEVTDCYFDENVQANVLLLGEAGTPLQSVLLKNCFFNPPIQTGFTACINASQVAYLACEGCENSGLIGSGSTAAFIKLAGVTKSDFTALRVRAGASSNFITADASSGLITMRSCDSAIDVYASAINIPDQLYEGVAASGGGTFTVDIPITIQEGVKFWAEVELNDSAGSSLGNIGSLIAKAVFQNIGGHVSLAAPIAGSANPMNSAAFAALEPEVSGAGFTGAGPPTAVWSVNGTSARLTVTNPGAVNATVDVKINQLIFGAIAPANPLTMAGLHAWYRPDTGITVVGGAVSQWQSNGFVGDGTDTLVQAVAGKRPGYTANDPNYNQQPTLQFVRANAQLLSSGVWDNPLVQPHTIVIIGNDDGTAAFQVFADNEQGSVQTCATANNDTVHNFYSTNAGGGWINSTVAPSTAPKCLICVFDGVSSKIYVSENTASVTGNCGADGRTGLTLGDDSAGGADYLNGTEAEILVFDHTLSAAEVAQVNAYVNNRYHIAIGA